MGCGESQPKLALTWDEYNAEFLRETETLRLPPGYRWPAQAPDSRLTEGIPNTYEEGCGLSDADGYWYMAWVKEWLDTRIADPVAAREALLQVERVKETYFYRVANDADGKVWYDNMIRRAKLGDPGPMEEYFIANTPTLLRDREEESGGTAP